MRRFEAARAALLASALGLSGAMVACGLLVPLERGPRARADAGDDAATTFDPCGPLPDPPKPRHAKDGRTIRFAAYHWDFRAGATPTTCETPGHDVDRVNTGGDDCRVNRSCQPLRESRRLNTCDRAGGVDNALEKLFNLIASATGRPDFEDDPNVAMKRGLSSQLIELVQYSGESDDEEVLVNFLGGAELEGVVAPNRYALTLNELQALPELWDGGQTDPAWIVAAETAQASAIPDSGLVVPLFSARGYVRDHILVVRETGSGVFSLMFDGRGLSYDRGVFSARIVERQGRYELTHARMGVSVPSSQFLSIAAAVEGLIPNQAEPLCATPLTYAAVREVICEALDLPRTDAGAVDDGAPCGNLSLGVSMAFVETRFVEDEPGVPRLQAGPVRRPCVQDDTEWCDDCARVEPSRCKIALSDGGLDAPAD